MMTTKRKHIRTLDVLLVSVAVILMVAVAVILATRPADSSTKTQDPSSVKLKSVSPTTVAEEQVFGLVNRRRDDLSGMMDIELPTETEPIETTVPETTPWWTEAETTATILTTAPTTTLMTTTTTTTPVGGVFKDVDVRYYVLSEHGLNMREAPSVQAPIVEKLPLGKAIRVIGLSEEWAKVRLQGYVMGYVSREFISLYPPTTEPAPTTTVTTTTARTTTAPARTTTAATTTKTSGTTSGTHAAEGLITFINPPKSGSNSVAKRNFAIFEKYNLVDKSISSSINRHYEHFKDNGDGTITVDGRTFAYAKKLPGRRATHYDGYAVCQASRRANGGVCWRGHASTVCHGTASGLPARRGIVAVPYAEIDTYPRGTVLFVQDYGIAVVGDRSNRHFDVCYDSNECKDLTRSNYVSGIYILTSP
jgi:3D (Asp-Asp-Asp) domain-containing protein/uncharacterized protein YgiM (DUF1202 family)